MSRIIFAVLLSGGLLLLSAPAFSQNSGYGGGTWHCPMMRGTGQGQGQHMMGQGRGQHMMGYRMQERQTPMTMEEARNFLQQRVQNNPNLKLGDVTEEKEYYEGKILTNDGSLVDKIQVDKQTGWWRSAY